MATTPGSQEWLNGFIKSLQKDNAAKNTAVTPAFSLPYMTSEAFDRIIKPQNYAPTEGVISRATDILLRPLYGAAQGLGSIAADVMGGKEDIESNPLKAVWEGISGKNKDTFVEQLDKLGTSTGVAAGAGTVANIVLDPVNFLFGTAGAKLLTATKGATKAGKVAQRIEDFDDFVRDAVSASKAEEAARNTSIAKQTQDLADKNWARQQSQMRSDIRPAQDAFADLKFGESGIFQDEVRSALDKLAHHQGAADRSALLESIKGRISDADYDFFKTNLHRPTVRRAKAREMLEEPWPGIGRNVEETVPETAASTPRTAAIQSKIDELSAKADELDRLTDEVISYGASQGYTRADVDAAARLSASKAIHGNTEVSNELFSHVMTAKQASALRSGKDILPSMYNDMVGGVAANQARILEQNPATEFWIKSPEPGSVSHAISQKDIVDLIDPDIMRDLGIKYTTSVPMPNITDMVARAADLATSTLPRDAIRNSIKEAGLKKSLATDNNKFRKQSVIRESVEKLADHLTDIRQEIADVARSNAAVYESREALAGRVVADKAIKQFDNALTEPNVGEAIKNAANPERLLSELPKDSDAGFIARETFGEHVAQVTNEFDTATARSVQQNIKQYAQHNLDKAAKNIRDSGGYKTYSQIHKEAEETVRRLFNVDPADFPTLHEAEIQLGVLRKRNVLMGLVKSFGSDSGDFAIDFANRTSYASAITKRFEANLNKIFKDLPSSDVRKVVSAFQREDGVLNLTPELQPYAEIVRADIDQMLGIEDGLMGSIFRNGIDVKDLEDALAHQGFHGNLFNVDEVELAKIKDPKSRNELIANSWKEYNFEDPIKELSSINSALLEVETNQVIGQSMSQFGVTENAAQALREQGVKLVKLPEEFKNLTKTRYMQHIPRKNSSGQTMLYPKDYIDQLINLERELNISSSWSSDSKFGKFVNDVVNPFYASWKPLVTIMNPGHNIRNFFSDLYANYMGGIRTLTPYRKSYAAIDSAGILPNAMDKVFGTALSSGKNIKNITIKVGKNKQEIPISQIAKWADEDGMFVSFRKSEDIIDSGNMKNVLEKLSDKVQRFGPVKVGAHWSESDTWLFRTAQYIHELENGTYKTLREARLAASNKARRYHPDTVGLTPEAKKYARLAMPFYSWFRQILPVVAETAMVKPARMTALNKVLWGFEYGFSPEDAQNATISNPFPIARNIPEFLQSNSYMGGSFVFNLGTPPEAMRDLGDHNFNRNMLGMLSPLIKIPIEAASGTNLGTGAEIKDASEYIDQQIPIVSKASSISGTSITGTLANWLQGENTKYKGPATFAGQQEITAPFGIDPQRSVRMGEKQQFLNTSLYNFFTGLGMQDTDRPSYAWYAAQDRFNRSR